jgi:hypothetical protein
VVVVDEPQIPISQTPIRRPNQRSRKRHTNHNHIPVTSTNCATSDATIDDCDIVTVSNERSFHRRCYPLTPFVVDDDDEEEVRTEDDNDDDNEKDANLKRKGGLWNDRDDRSYSSQQQIQPIHTTSIKNTSTTPFLAQQQSTDHIQSWIVSLSNRAINFTELIRQPDYNNYRNSNHPNMIEPVLDECNNTCNDIYLVDDDQDNDYDDHVGYEDKYVDHL